MRLPKSSYRLKRFVNAEDPEFADAIDVYLRNTPANLRTATNEIAYWIGEFSKRFGDEFYIFGFYRNRQLVGFAEAAYLRDQQLFVFDYLAIDKIYRGNNIFHEFVAQLKQYLEGLHPEYKYAVAEVGWGSGQKSPSQDSSLLIRLLKSEGFRVIRAPYYHPRMEPDDPEGEMQASLLIFSRTPLEFIHAETYLGIIRTIFYKYYLPWQTVLPHTVEAYRKHLEEVYSRVQAALKRKKTIPVNGYKITFDGPTRVHKVGISKPVLFAMQALVFVILMTAAMVGLKTFSRLSTNSFLAIYAAAIISFLAISGIVSKNARAIFSEIISAAKSIYGKRADGSKPTETKQESTVQTDRDAQ